jgi:hypothetical protein
MYSYSRDEIGLVTRRPRRTRAIHIATRVDAAKAAAPYVHFRKSLVDTSGREDARPLVGEHDSEAHTRR